MRSFLLFLAFVTAPVTLSAGPVDLSTLKLPQGFHIDVFGKAPVARMMAFSPGGVLLVASTQKGDVLALPDPEHTGHAARVETVLSGLDLPHGIAFYQGALYLATSTAITRYDWNEAELKAANPRKIADLPASRYHVTRTIVFGGGKLYASAGSSCNVCQEKDPRRAAVMKMNPDGSDSRIFASGLRNAVGLAWSERTQTVWATVNGRDNLGDDLPPDEIDNLGLNGGNFGWPYCYDDHGHRVPDPQFHDPARCTNTIGATIDLQAHSAPLGLTFYTGSMFPHQYQGGLFVGYHGSWNRSVPTGYKVVFIPFDASGQPSGPPQDFITGWMPTPPKTDAEWGRPVGVIVGPDGSVYISDDYADVIYRVTYGR
jgi:glucose/arabinose dehydrogenase